MSIGFTGDWLPKEQQCALGEGCYVGNLECAFADGEVTSGKAYTSVLPKLYLDNIPRIGFSALSLANNHVYDIGTDAFIDMKLSLAEKCPGIQFFGTKDKPYAILEVDGRRVAVIGSLEPCRSRGEDIFREEDVEFLIRKIRREFGIVYVYPHWGKEGEYTRWPSPAQRKLAQLWIDAGADGVFGSHSHVFQGREYYRGKPIYYSLGNFFFPHPESRLYEGTDVGLSVEVCDDGAKVVERFVKDGKTIVEDKEIGGLRAKLDAISEPLKDWATWKWAKTIGPFNLKKNTASWKIRLKKNFIKTFPKFLAWQFLPKTLLFRMASLFR